MTAQVLRQVVGMATQPALQLQALRAIRQDNQQAAQGSAHTAWLKAFITAVLPDAVAALQHTLHSQQQQQLSPDELQVDTVHVPVSLLLTQLELCCSSLVSCL